MKTLYELLEVSENASKEIIEKAYKVLAKKYHPDLQAEGEKLEAEKKMKQINEAYEVLSDETKRKEYDLKLIEERRQEEAKKQPQPSYSQNPYEQPNQTYTKPMSEQEYREALKRQYQERREEQERQRQMQEQYEQRYQQAYEGYLRSLGYKIKYKWTWKRFKDLMITIFIIILICTILWFFPPTNKLIMDFYNSNSIIQAVIETIGNVFKGIWNGICAVFQKK
ncbi:MAG: J domain-containing protein [Clostridia bacterium]|jgi:DnaJ-class molecular chaperone|nr:J domain-containing protein [Clostridia bacterium]